LVHQVAELPKIEPLVDEADFIAWPAPTAA
jgi:hypothetical protein